MKLSEFKKQLAAINELNFTLSNGIAIPQHFHVTEVGQITKHFIDCGGTVRNEMVVNFQLWEANDFDHRLAPQKLTSIIELSEKVLKIEDAEIEVEYQNDTIGKYGVEFNGKQFILIAKQTNCLDSDACGISTEKLKVNLKNLQAENKEVCCSSNGKCC